jgi:integrase
MSATTKKRSHGDGGIDERGPNIFRLRYRVKGKRFSTTFRGTLSEARKELRRVIRSGDTDSHIAPDKVTLGEWIDRWIALLERQQDGGERRRRGLVNARTIERYAELLRCHVKPTLGARPLQQIQASEIDDLYMTLEKKRSPRTVHHVHTVLKACLTSAVRKGLIAGNQAERADAPSPGESDRGIALDNDQLRTLLAGFKDSVLFPIVAVAAFTGARRNEILALRWNDLIPTEKALRIERAIEETKAGGRRVKEPKTHRGTRSIQIDDDLLALLLAERDKYLRIKAGVPQGAAVDLSLVKLPADALIFPSSAGPDFDFSRLRDAHAVTRQFVRRARKLGFPGLRFHDLRGTHETMLLDAGVPVHVVAARCGHDPAVLLRTYARRTRKADTSAAAVIGALAAGILKG